MKKFILGAVSFLTLTLSLSSTVFGQSPVLIVGDERVQGRFGELLEKALFEKDGTRSARVSACGLNVLDWIQGSKTTCGYFEKRISGEIIQKKESETLPLITFLSDVKPEFLVFIHGNRGLDTTPKAIQAQIELIGRLLSSTHTGCLWMGPGEEVATRVSNAYYKAVQMIAIEAGCAVIDAPLFSTLMSEGSVQNIDPIVEIVAEMILMGRNL